MVEFKIDSVTRNTLSRQVLEKFIQLLMEGDLQPGDKLPPEMDLMHMFDVSRPVLREALSSLETLEIVKRRPRGGTYINEKIGSSPFRAMLALSINNVPAVIEARMTLELGLVTLAAEKISEDQIARLEETIVAIANTVDDDYGALDREFHRIIAESANNPVVSGMIDSLLITHQKTDSLITFREPDITVRHHSAIVKALKGRDPVEAFKEMYNHLQYVREKILANQKGV
ncbi:FadR family transcriptional regulator [Salinicoccus sp. ID82-1]|uniref:FadR family transcriptional regulator n=1 Tax=Salinicoccus cyprini TaxID=2493691 RepID=A0A558AT02_9STAP|nr:MULTISPECIES: FadR/GntR family transcriptional regulator [Salinicoccus]MCG1009734.1 FadR family transcriptional regulator [Salinicoccus sp. ID82-1]TVT27395.1 FadR family transcriptional regulator [Salinicoccus cyprini]